MTHSIVLERSAAQKKARPELRPGFTVRVHERIQEGNKERIQVFEGLLIAMHKGSTPTDSTITVRKIVSGIGTEKVFPVHSPNIEKIEVKKVAKVRRAKLFFLRGRRGKAARLSERFTTAEEFADAAAGADIVEPELEAEETATEESTTEAKAEESTEVKEEATEEPKAEKSEATEDKKADDK